MKSSLEDEKHREINNNTNLLQNSHLSSFISVNTVIWFRKLNHHKQNRKNSKQLRYQLLHICQS